jgi:hypothetical protein
MNRFKQQSGSVFGITLLAGLVASAAAAQPPEAKIVMAGMIDAKIIKQVDYSFLDVGYEADGNVLYFAARDGGHFDPPAHVFYRVPMADLNVVNVISNSDVTIKDGKQVEMTTGIDNAATGDFIRLSRGCTVKLVSKGYEFGWAMLAEDQVQDGKVTVDYATLEVDKTKEVQVGFFECDHARMLQNEFHKLHKQVKKGY